jgi:hypothetical protein
MDTTNNFVGGGDSSSEKYNKDTYIGYLKMKKGGMKIISGDKDEQIIANRNKILSHLDIVLSGGKRLKEKNIKKYFKALGGKYIRNDMCVSGDNSNCKGGKNVSVHGAHKLLKLISKKNLPIDNALEIFKGSAPKLYEKLESKIKGGYNAVAYDSDSSKSSRGGKYIDTFEKNHNIAMYEYREFFTNVDNKEIRNKLIDEIEAELRSNQNVSSSNGVVYMSALEGLYNSNFECRSKSKDCDQKKGKAITIGKRLFDSLSRSEDGHKKAGRVYKDVNVLFTDNAPNLMCAMGKHNEFCDNKGGYDRRDDYPEERRGGYDERDYYPEERRGGYDERDYYPEERRGGYDRRDDYYPDEMHGGNLGLFRNEIRNNITDLRHEILNIVLN